MSVALLPTITEASTSVSSWGYAGKPPSLASYVVGNHFWLGRVLTLVHFARKLWHWHRQANEIYQYFQNPLLAVGDLAASQLSENRQFLQTAFLITEVISSGFQAEKAREAMVNTWEEIIDQIRHPREVRYSIPNVHDPKGSFYYIFLKIKEIFRLVGRLLVHSYTFSMHVMDVTDLIWDPKARKRANRRFATNIYNIYQLSQTQLNELMLAHKLQPMPFLKYLGIQPKHLESMVSLRTKMMSLDTQRASLDTQRTSLDTQRTSLDTQRTSLDAQLTGLHKRLWTVESGLLSTIHV